MHSWVLLFAAKHASKFVGRTLEVGSFNVNGSVRSVIPVTIGTDMRPGPDVDEVCTASQLIKKFGCESFDNVVSTEMLEHAEDWKNALDNMWGVLKPGGMFLLTTRSPGFPLHDYPGDYWRFTVDDMKKIFPDGVVVSDTEAPGVGVCIQKTTSKLDFSDVSPRGPR